ncbi:MAG: hypothetical protein K2J67_08795 [Lachnospiraceae bacterium]|nr:hypothetical protein [Lachnospiraceae bacterium]
MYKMDASITVFLTLIFGVILAVVTAAFENVRFLTVDAYVRSAAETAAMSVFGDYNRELYQEYGLFGYGGYAGHGVTELSEALTKALSANLQTSPGGQDTGNGSGARKKSGEYTSIYRIGSVEANIKESQNITDESIFYEQIEAYLTTQIVADLGSKIKETYRDMANTDQGNSLQENLDMTSEYEQGIYDRPVVEEDPAEQGEGASQRKEEVSVAEASPKPDHAGGNPLETFRELLRDGALNLVCDAKSLSRESIDTVYSEQRQENHSSSKDGKEVGSADLLKNLLADHETIFADNNLQISGKHMKLIRYAQHVFPYYRKSGKQHFRYGLEYLVSGSKQERDNLQGIINRLLIIRTTMNLSLIQL